MGEPNPIVDFNKNVKIPSSIGTGDVPNQTVMVQFNLSDYERRLQCLETNIPILSGDVKRLQGFVEGTVNSFKLVEQRLDQIDSSLNHKILGLENKIDSGNQKIETIDVNMKALHASLAAVKESINETKNLIKGANESVKSLDWWATYGLSPFELKCTIWLALAFVFVGLLKLVMSMF